jgi:hypothetical protein
MKKDPFILLVVLLALWAGWHLLRPGYFKMHDDLQMMRQLAMENCFYDGQIPCRWTQHMGYGFGFPLFNYYPPLPYLIGQIFRIVGFSFVTTVKLTFLFSLIVSGITMYILAKELWGRLGGLISSAFYIWAPYHSVDIYVRGAMNESWALAWFPLLLLSSLKLIQKARFRWMIVLALSWFALLTTHNLMVMIFVPFFAVWVLFWLWREKSWLTIPLLIISGIWGFGLAAFFTIPVLLEKNLVQIEGLVSGYNEYIAHFASINQLLFSRFWGYGPSVWETEGDKMSFQVGHLHWIFSFVIVGLLAVKTAKKRKIFQQIGFMCLLLAASGWFATFMVHQKSIFIWQALPLLAFLQFPWRFLTLSILAFSLLVGSLIPILNIKGNKLYLLVFILLAAVIFLNKDYFQPEEMFPLTDKEKFSGTLWEVQQTAGIYDYLPRTAKTAPKDAQKAIAKIVQGVGEISEGWQNSNSARFRADIKTNEAIIEIGILEFPNWRVFVDGKQKETFVGEDEWGRIHIKLTEGRHKVFVKLFDTPPRILGNIISFFSWAALFFFLFVYLFCTVKNLLFFRWAR